MSNIEIFANVMTAICIFLAGRNSVHTWWTGIVATLAFGVLFFQNQLYAEVTLQAFFVVTGIIGWVYWAKGVEVAKISFEDIGRLYLWLIITALTALMYAIILFVYTDAYMPFADSNVLSLSILGQLLLMRRKVQSWYIWVVVNCISVPLYMSRGLTLTAILYTAFLIHAIYTSVIWTKEGFKNDKV